MKQMEYSIDEIRLYLDSKWDEETGGMRRDIKDCILNSTGYEWAVSRIMWHYEIDERDARILARYAGWY